MQSNKKLPIGQLTTDLSTHNIIITTAVSINTNTTDSNGYGQNGKNVMISNGANPITITCRSDSATNFVASYTKLGLGAITFAATIDCTLVLMDATTVLNGQVGSTACLTRTGNTYYLNISNK